MEKNDDWESDDTNGIKKLYIHICIYTYSHTQTLTNDTLLLPVFTY
jgi:hypothetical protein